MKHSSDIFQFDDSMEWEVLDDHLKRKILGFNDDLMMVRIHFKKGGVGALHSHSHSQSTYVESGKFEVTIGDEKKALKKGDGFFAPPGIEHGVVNIEEGVLIDVFNPIREDFINKK
jgi:quercetin dioxygenase-like cupin family protein